MGRKERREEANHGHLQFLSAEQYRERFGRDPESAGIDQEPWSDPGLWHGWTMPWPPPTVVLVMAEHGDTFLWDRTPARLLGAGGLDPAVLGLPARLTEQLQAWNERYTAHGTSRTWLDHGRNLAFDLQRQFEQRGLNVDVQFKEADGIETHVAPRRSEP